MPSLYDLYEIPWVEDVASTPQPLADAGELAAPSVASSASAGGVRQHLGQAAAGAMDDVTEDARWDCWPSCGDGRNLIH